MFNYECTAFILNFRRLASLSSVVAILFTLVASVFAEYIQLIKAFLFPFSIT